MLSKPWAVEESAHASQHVSLFRLHERVLAGRLSLELYRQDLWLAAFLRQVARRAVDLHDPVARQNLCVGMDGVPLGYQPELVYPGDPESAIRGRDDVQADAIVRGVIQHNAQALLVVFELRRDLVRMSSGVVDGDAELFQQTLDIQPRHKARTASGDPRTQGVGDDRHPGDAARRAEHKADQVRMASQLLVVRRVPRHGSLAALRRQAWHHGLQNVRRRQQRIIPIEDDQRVFRRAAPGVTVIASAGCISPQSQPTAPLRQQSAARVLQQARRQAPSGAARHRRRNSGQSAKLLLLLGDVARVLRRQIRGGSGLPVKRRNPFLVELCPVPLSHEGELP
mmetsp:Transcript_112159/g.322425  ORF Transcript_112159/g.322425 Transcript_112159/m.322425 type:complete len:339 (+) Transcript_112159:3-1019(+)